MKIAIHHVTCTFALGGSETYAWSLAKFLHERGHTVHLVAGSVPDPIIKFPELSVKLGRFVTRDQLPRLRPKTRKIVERLTFAMACRRLFLNEQYDVINIHKTYDIPFALWARRRTGCRIVWRSHGPGQFPGARHLVGRVDRIYAVSLCTRNEVLSNYGIDPTVIYTGVDAEFFKPSARNELIGTPRLLYFGRLQRFKGIGHLIRALSQIRELDWEARIVGDGPEKGSIEALIRSLGLSSRVTMDPAKRTPDEVRRLLEESNIVCFPSSNKDTFSNAMLEAMGMGRAVIASDCGGFPEAISNAESGLLVPHGDPTAIAGAISKLLGSRELLQTVSVGSRARVERCFLSRSNFERVEKMMEQCCQFG